MSNNSGIEEKVGNLNMEEKNPKAKAGAKGGDKKKKAETGGFPLEVSHGRVRVYVSISL